MADTAQPMRVVVFLDGRPGHEKQSLGILRGLEHRVSVECTYNKVTRPSIFRRILQFAQLFSPVHTPGDDAWKNADLLLGTGSSTHLPMLHSKKRYSIPAVICMHPEPILVPFFDLCCVPEHDGVSLKDNIIHTIGAPNCSIDAGMHDDTKGLILLGGVDSASHRWDSVVIMAKVELIARNRPGISWTVSSSPRTPDDCVQKAQDLASSLKNLTFFDYRETEVGWVEEQYDRCRFVWVTADSISMIFEALTAGCRVGLLPVEWRKGGKKFKKNETALHRRGLVLSFADWQAGNEHWERSDPLCEAQRCADIILERLWNKS